jgi:hypothetical protein
MFLKYYISFFLSFSIDIFVQEYFLYDNHTPLYAHIISHGSRQYSNDCYLNLPLVGVQLLYFSALQLVVGFFFFTYYIYNIGARNEFLELADLCHS